MCAKFHALGFVAFYSEPQLCGYVMIKPQEIIDAISAVITVYSKLPVHKVTPLPPLCYAFT